MIMNGRMHLLRTHGDLGFGYKCPKEIEQCFFNSVPDPFNGQIANLISKPPKVIELRIYVKKPIWSAIETTLFYYSSDKRLSLLPKPKS